MPNWVWRWYKRGQSSTLNFIHSTSYSQYFELLHTSREISTDDGATRVCLLLCNASVQPSILCWDVATWDMSMEFDGDLWILQAHMFCPDLHQSSAHFSFREEFLHQDEQPLAILYYALETACLLFAVHSRERFGLAFVWSVCACACIINQSYLAWFSENIRDAADSDRKLILPDRIKRARSQIIKVI